MIRVCGWLFCARSAATPTVPAVSTAATATVAPRTIVSALMAVFLSLSQSSERLLLCRRFLGLLAKLVDRCQERRDIRGDLGAGVRPVALVRLLQVLELPVDAPLGHGQTGQRGDLDA